MLLVAVLLLFQFVCRFLCGHCCLWTYDWSLVYSSIHLVKEMSRVVWQLILDPCIRFQVTA